MRVGVLLLLALSSLAGCIGGDEAELDGPAHVPATGLVAHTPSGAAAVPSAYLDLDTVPFHTGFFRGEPTVGVSSDGVVFTTASGRLREPMPGGEGLIARSMDGGESWQVVQDPVRNAKTDTDPWLWVDPITDRVFNTPLWIGCSWITWSDDLGDTWDGHPLAGCGLPGHDHQKTTSGPPPDGAGGSYPTIVYYAYNSFRMVPGPLETDGTQVSVSLDGGQTWSLSVQAHPSDPCHGGINGPVEIAPDGSAYVPKPTCDGPAISRSEDGGATWQVMPVVEGAGMIGGLATIHAAVDSDGTVYVLWPGEDRRLYYAYSTDKAETWSAPIVASAPQVQGVAFVGFDAGGPGRLGIAYIGTEADVTDVDYGSAPPEVVWHFYAATADNADTENVTIVTQQVTTDDDPVERGCITGSLDEPCRNLRDFIDVQVRQGRMFVAYADGCDKCRPDDSDRLPRGETVVAIQQNGPSLDDGQPLAPFTGRN